MSMESTLVGLTDGGGSGIDPRPSTSSSLLSERGGLGGRYCLSMFVFPVLEAVTIVVVAENMLIC